MVILILEYLFLRDKIFFIREDPTMAHIDKKNNQESKKLGQKTKKELERWLRRYYENRLLNLPLDQDYSISKV